MDGSADGAGTGGSTAGVGDGGERRQSWDYRFSLPFLLPSVAASSASFLPITSLGLSRRSPLVSGDDFFS
jgi:hypothetical protein